MAQRLINGCAYMAIRIVENPFRHGAQNVPSRITISTVAFSAYAMVGKEVLVAIHTHQYLHGICYACLLVSFNLRHSEYYVRIEHIFGYAVFVNAL
jgi:hypothetical protein